MDQSLIVSLLTIVGSGVMSAVVTHRLIAQREERDFQRRKVEELFLSATTYSKALGAYFVTHLAVLDGGISLAEARDALTERGLRSAESWDQLRMIVGVYFPAVQPKLEEVVVRREARNRIVGAFKTAHRKGETDGIRFLKPYREAFDALTQAEMNLKLAILAESKRLNRAAWRVDGAQEPSALVLGD